MDRRSGNIYIDSIQGKAFNYMKKTVSLGKATDYLQIFKQLIGNKENISRIQSGVICNEQQAVKRIMLEKGIM